MSTIDPEIVWKPHKGPQEDFIRCPLDEILFGGARGGGKSDAVLGKWLGRAWKYGENENGLIIRREREQLQDMIDRSHTIFGKLGFKWTEQKKTWTSTNGAKIRFHYLERLADADKIQGGNLTFLAVEEAGTFPAFEPIRRIKASMRSKAGVPVQLVMTANPGGVGHSWLKGRYKIEEYKRGYEVIRDDETGEERVFIPSKVTDNTTLMENDPKYIHRLRGAATNPAILKAWIQGDWDIVVGAYFSSFDKTVHVLPAHEWLKRIPGVGAPGNCFKLRAFDWGSAKPFSVGWWAVSDGTWGLPRDAMVCFQEWYGNTGDPESPNVGLKMFADGVARGILARERFSVEDAVADPAIFQQHGGPSINESMLIEGCWWRPADHARIPGWAQVSQRLAPVDKDGNLRDPLIYWLDNCRDSIRTIEALPADEKNPEDVDTDAEDHAPDQVRYACMSRPIVVESKSEPPPVRVPDNNVVSLGVTFDQIMEERKRRREEREAEDIEL